MFVGDRKQAKDDLHCSKATLRILRLLVSYGTDFTQPLRAGFLTTPTSFWSYIIPQLFAHIGKLLTICGSYLLGHPEPFVSGQVMDLIKRIGRDHPSLIVYPAVVDTCTANEFEQPQYHQIMTDLQTHSPALVKVMWAAMTLTGLRR